MTTDVSRRTVLKAVGLGSVVLAGGTTTGAARNGQQPASESTPDVLFDFDFPILPENVAIDQQGNKYLSIPPIGQVWKVSSDNVLPDPTSPFAEFTVTGTQLVGPVGVEVDPRGTVYVCFASDLETDPDANPSTNGVWRVEPDGTESLYAALPPANSGSGPTFPNDLTLYDDSVLVTDSFRGVVYRAWPDGEAEVWASGSLLQPNPGGFGADGIAVSKDGTVYVSNLDQGRIVEIPVERDGSAGTPGTFVRDDQLIGADGLAFDTRENLYVAVNAQNKVVRISPDRNIETLASGRDLGFDFPSDVTFGTSRGEQKSVFITNLAFGPPGGPGPSFMKLDVGVPGLPIHR